jgi:CheY-like chemotaxis protein
MVSAPGRTCMALLLPRETGEPSPPDSPPALPASAEPGRSLQVLVVDDDPLVLKVSGALLASLGHWVTPVSTPAQVDLLLRGGQRWDLVLCDVVLEDGSGLDVYSVLQRHGHTPAWVFVSGNVPAALQERIARTEALAVLHKPFDRETLRELIEQVPGGGTAQTGP